MTTLELWDIVDYTYEKEKPLSATRFPTFWPSSASCYNELSPEKEVIGACIRSEYFRCAGYEKTEAPHPHMYYIWEMGNMWEALIVDRMKLAGVYLDSKVKFAILDKNISGELDIVIQHPDGESKPIVIDVKSFYGYQAKKDIIGNKSLRPKPKDSNVMQIMIYLDNFSNDLSCGALMYKARDDEARKTMWIDLDDYGHPIISVLYNKNEEHIYTDKRISLNGIYSRYAELMQHLKEEKIPVPDYVPVYSKEYADILYSQSKISKTKYEAVSKEKQDVGDFMCNYCDYKTLCMNFLKEGK